MNIYLGNLSYSLSNSKLSTAVRSIVDGARLAGKRPPSPLPERTLAVRMPEETKQWLRHQAETKGCAMADVVRAYIADQAVAELTALYQNHTASLAEFAAALWSAMGYEPEPSPEEEMRPGT